MKIKTLSLKQGSLSCCGNKSSKQEWAYLFYVNNKETEQNWSHVLENWKRGLSEPELVVYKKSQLLKEPLDKIYPKAKTNRLRWSDHKWSVKELDHNFTSNSDN